MIRATLDVNVVVSALLSSRGAPRAILTAWEAARFIHVTADGLIYLTQEKLASPRIGGSYGVTPEDIRWITTLLIEEAEIVPVPQQAVAAVTGDPEDDYVLATALLGKTDALVSGDRALLARQRYRGVSILSPRGFLDRLDEVTEP